MDYQAYAADQEYEHADNDYQMGKEKILNAPISSVIRLAEDMNSVGLAIPANVLRFIVEYASNRYRGEELTLQQVIQLFEEDRQGSGSVETQWDACVAIHYLTGLFNYRFEPTDWGTLRQSIRGLGTTPAEFFAFSSNIWSRVPPGLHKVHFVKNLDSKSVRSAPSDSFSTPSSSATSASASSTSSTRKSAVTSAPTGRSMHSSAPGTSTRQSTLLKTTPTAPGARGTRSATNH
eukprot:GILI01033481.1.p1 GENE.GILI01033481.1~~GILI01033481.1.p1  ORF type:complete len:272 (+),score=40.31 GILI01033481.1:116-817(+)